MRTIFAFDTATSRTSCALLCDGEVVGERLTEAREVLAAADELVRRAGLQPGAIDALVVGTGPGSFTGVRIGLAVARGLALALDVQGAGVPTLDALAAGAPGATPVIDARRREVFTLLGGEPAVLAPSVLPVEEGTLYVGDGARRYRGEIESRGGLVPRDGDERHVPRACFHAALARDLGPVDAIEPLYLRVPDAEKSVR